MLHRTTPGAAEIYQLRPPQRRSRNSGVYPNPYPIEDQRWDFSVPAAEQSGIFMAHARGCRFRNHFAAQLVARGVVRKTGNRLPSLSRWLQRAAIVSEFNFRKGKLQLIEKWKAYPDYLRDSAA